MKDIIKLIKEHLYWRVFLTFIDEKSIENDYYKWLLPSKEYTLCQQYDVVKGSSEYSNMSYRQYDILVLCHNAIKSHSHAHFFKINIKIKCKFTYKSGQHWKPTRTELCKLICWNLCEKLILKWNKIVYYYVAIYIHLRT